MKRETKKEKAFEYKEEQVVKKQKNLNTTDPDSGYYHRDHKEEGFYVFRPLELSMGKTI